MGRKRRPTPEELEATLRRMGVPPGPLIRMARAGQLFDIVCEMPQCYCPHGRRDFKGRAQPMPAWALNADHYPKMEKDGGKLVPWNIRLAHVECNRRDFGWRDSIRRKLERGKSLDEIAEELNRKKADVSRPHGHPEWTAALVRQAYVS